VSRHRRLFVLVLAALAAAAAPARAADSPLLKPRTLLAGTLSAAGTFKGECHAAYRPGRSGIATRTVAAPGAGAVHVTLNGARGDWDVAVFDATGRPRGRGRLA
jgi:hypothetical protein